MSASEVVRQAAEETKQVARKAHPWLRPLVRVGYAAKGIIYGMIGALALMAALRYGGGATNQRGAITAIAQQPFGSVFLIAMAVGLLAYSLWRLLMAVYNPEQRKPLKRFGYAVTGLFYIGIAFAAIQASIFAKAPGEQRGYLWTVMAHPAGRFLVIVFALVLIALSVGQFINAYKKKFLEILESGKMSEGVRRFATISGRVGLISRGVLFLLVGGTLIFAALHENPREAGGTEKGLRALAASPYGHWPLGVVATGLLVYMAFMFVEARYRKIPSA